MDSYAAETALRRARKRIAHATVRLTEAETPRAKARHARRLRNARQLEAESRWTFEHLAMCDA